VKEYPRKKCPCKECLCKGACKHKDFLIMYRDCNLLYDFLPNGTSLYERDQECLALLYRSLRPSTWLLGRIEVLNGKKLLISEVRSDMDFYKRLFSGFKLAYDVMRKKKDR
jgi:hypothetical protein